MAGVTSARWRTDEDARSIRYLFLLGMISQKYKDTEGERKRRRRDRGDETVPVAVEDQKTL